MTWRDGIAAKSVGYFDNRIESATGEEEDYLFNTVNQAWAYAEFATQLYGRIIELVADEGLTIEQAIVSITDEELKEFFDLACSSAEGL